MSPKVSFLLFGLIATETVAVDKGIGLIIKNVSPSSNQAALNFLSGNMILEGLACSAMATAIPGLTKLECTSFNYSISKIVA